MDVKELRKQAAQAVVDAKAILASEAPTAEQLDEAKTLMANAKSFNDRANQLEDAQKMEDELKAAKLPANLPTGNDAPVDEPADNKAELLKSVHVMRYGKDLDSPTSMVMREVYGNQDYRELNYQQTKAFVKYIRGGAPERILTRQVWGINDVKSMLKYGMEVAEIKSTMVEGQDVLGGYAVPVEMGSQIIQRAYGLTAVRSGGATVVQTASKSIEFLKFSGGNDQYGTNMRGAWGNEVKNPPDETNLTYGLETIPVHIYTYKVPMSTSFLEDAQNVISVFTQQVADTLGIDEDNAFLTGNGTNKPLGILPDSANTEGITEVNSTDALLLKMDGIKKLRRGVLSHYRVPGRASWIGNNSTGEALELLKDGEGRYFFEDGLVVGDTYKGAVWRESEAMPDVAANAFPLIWGDLTGYMIVERLGLAIQRYNDAYTGINTVQFHVRRRLGGRLVEPWKLAVQKVAV